MFQFVYALEFQVAADDADQAECDARDALAACRPLTVTIIDPVEDEEADRQYWHGRASVLAESNLPAVNFEMANKLSEMIESGNPVLRYVTVTTVAMEPPAPQSAHLLSKAALQEKLTEMRLYDNTGHPHDEGYMQAIDEMAKHLLGGSDR